ncbi:membrane protein insertion efficiency factor YidD [Leucobacter sp. CSA1]|uniref:Putative membrane protein insertion efficiency factor n=1 Tax=Leucobacter chromiisoli TaxID=2796471 RepID=A0A934UUS4_9MICO|nr:membrane protein insertion efficiency factor YidD [Leucobacter chromiisoli]MBK0418731.1 membrane protein insertion efficiency factor YidD [Leucobacter chromiisoli]
MRPAAGAAPAAVRAPRGILEGLALEAWLLPRNAAIAVMLVYRRVISPLYGQVCRYHPSCSRYSLEAYQQRGLVLGLVLTAWRLLRCNPFSAGGVDDVPPQRRPRFMINSRGFVRPVPRKA